MNKHEDQIEQLRNRLLFSQTLLEMAICGQVHDGWRLMAQHHVDDVAKHLHAAAQAPKTCLVAASWVDDVQVLVEVLHNNECHVAMRSASWDTWPAGVWFTLEEKNCG